MSICTNRSSNFHNGTNDTPALSEADINQLSDVDRKTVVHVDTDGDMFVPLAFKLRLRPTAVMFASNTVWDVDDPA